MNSSVYVSGSGVSSGAKTLIAAVAVIVVLFLLYSYYNGSEGIQSNPYIGTFDGMTPIPIFKSMFMPPNNYWK